MPGLTGVVGEWFSLDLVDRMVRCMQHEPFYRVFSHSDEAARFGVARVGPNIPNPEPQPIKNEDRSVLGMMEGELSNSEELRQHLLSKGHRLEVGNDLDLLIHLYEEEGETFLASAKGRFAVFLYDSVRHCALIGTDRHGFMPLYYTCPKGSLLFSCEIKSLLKCGGVDRSVDSQSIRDFFCYSTVLDHRTFFKSIRRLSPGRILIFRGERLSEVSYWNAASLLSVPELEEGEFLERGESILRQVTRQYFAQDDVGFSLTGGWDTRTLMAVIDHGEARFPCFTLTGPRRDCIDARIAAKVARVCSQTHYTIRLGENFLADFPRYAERCVFISDGMARIERAHEILLNCAARQYCDVRVTGAYGTQLTRGVSLFRHRLPSLEFFSTELRSLLDSPDSSSPEFFLDNVRGGRLDWRKILLFILEQDIRQGSWTGNHALELSQIWIRTPYTHEDLIALMFRCPTSLPKELARQRQRFAHRSTTDRIRSGILKLVRKPEPPVLQSYVIARNNTALTRIPVNLGEEPVEWTGWSGRLRRCYTAPLGMLDIFHSHYEYPGITRYVDRLIQSTRAADLFLGFNEYTYYRLWLHGPLREYIREILLDPRTLRRGYFDPVFLEQAVNDHVRGRRCYAAVFGNLISFELWNRLFVDQVDQ